MASDYQMMGTSRSFPTVSVNGELSCPHGFLWNGQSLPCKQEAGVYVCNSWSFFYLALIQFFPLTLPMLLYAWEELQGWSGSSQNSQDQFWICFILESEGLETEKLLIWECSGNCKWTTSKKLQAFLHNEDTV